MHSFIISGGTKKDRHAYIQNEYTTKDTKSYDVVTLSLENNSIGIEDIRTFQKRLTLVPYASAFTIGIIHDADHLTHEAQQALLKTLEEPPPHVLIYLEAENPDSLLPTIRSRCQHVIDASNHDAIEYDETVDLQLTHLLGSSFASRASIIDVIASTRDTALLFIQKAILSARTHIKADKTRHQGKILLHLLFRTKEQLEANVTPKLVFDVMWLEFQNA